MGSGQGQRSELKYLRVFILAWQEMLIEMREGRLKSAVRAHVPREVRNWLRSPTRTLEWLWLGAKWRLGWNERFEIVEGRTLRCHPAAYKAVQRRQMENGEQAAELAQFVSHCRPGMLLFDIGANFGIFSLVCAKFGGWAVAVEPSPIGARMIRNQVSINQTHSVAVVEAATGDTEGTIGMLSSGVFSDGYFRYDPGRDARELTHVCLTTVDRLSDQFGEPSHIKVDVEGYEDAVLRGARRTLSRCAPTIFLELHNNIVRSSGRELGSCLTELESLGYKMHSVCGKEISLPEALRPAICRIVAKRA